MGSQYSGLECFDSVEDSEDDTVNRCLIHSQIIWESKARLESDSEDLFYGNKCVVVGLCEVCTFEFENRPDEKAKEIEAAIRTALKDTLN